MCSFLCSDGYGLRLPELQPADVRQRNMRDVQHRRWCLHAMPRSNGRPNHLPLHVLLYDVMWCGVPALWRAQVGRFEHRGPLWNNLFTRFIDVATLSGVELWYNETLIKHMWFYIYKTWLCYCLFCFSSKISVVFMWFSHPYSLGLLKWRRGNIILIMGSANERWRYIETSSAICWAHTPLKDMAK